MTFKDIPIGSNFVFKSSSEFSVGKSFRKISARGYREVDSFKVLGGEFKVGTIKVGVKLV